MTTDIIAEIATNLLADHDRSNDRGGDNTLQYAVKSEGHSALGQLEEDSDAYWTAFDERQEELIKALTRMSEGVTTTQDAIRLYGLYEVRAIALTRAQVKELKGHFLP